MRAWLLCALITTLWRIHGLCRWKGWTKLLQHEYELSLFTPISRETAHPRETCKSVTRVGINMAVHLRAKWPLHLPRNSFDSLNYFTRNVAINTFFFSYRGYQTAYIAQAWQPMTFQGRVTRKRGHHEIPTPVITRNTKQLRNLNVYSRFFSFAKFL